MEEISQTIAKIRASKDMDNKNSQDIDSHIEAIERLRLYHNEILKKINILNEYEEKKKIEMRSCNNKELKILIKGGVIGGFILLIIQYLLNKLL